MSAARRAVAADPADIVSPEAAAPAPPAPVVEEPVFTGAQVDLPHVSIEGFCAQDATQGAFRRFAADHRLARAQVRLVEGGVGEAVSRYREVASPHLLIVEIEGPPETVLFELDRLAEVCEPHTNVLVIGHVNDIGLFRAAMAREIADYLVAPVGARALLDVATRLFVTGEETAGIGRVISVIGAKGGVGSSAIAQGVARRLAHLESSDTLLIDFDMCFGAAELGFNLEAERGLADALRDISRLDGALLERLMTPCGDHLRLLTAQASLDAEAEPSPEAVARVIDVTRRALPYVVVDLPHQWNAWVKDALAHSDGVAVVSDFSLPAMRNASHLIETLTALRPNDRPPTLVLNNRGAHGRAEATAQEIEDALGLSADHIFDHDPKAYETAQTQGVPVIDTGRGKRHRERMDALVGALTGRAPKAAAPRRGLFGLFGRR